MNPFPYSDEKISLKEYAIALPAMMVGIGILTLPRALASVTEVADGWICILAGGLLFMFFAWMTARLASRFPGQTLHEYGAKIIGRPLSALFTFVCGIGFLLAASLETRALGNITKLYFFERTPLEAVMLVFLFVVMYGVSGSRAALFRLNMMFFPIVLFIAVLVQFFNVTFFELDNLRPVAVTSAMGYLKGIGITSFSFVGYVIILFYTSLMREPHKAPKGVVIGMTIPIILYEIVFVFAIGVMGHEGTYNTVYPTIETAKEVSVPGGFFDRFESIFFTIWIMTIFNTTCMAYDVVVMVMQSLFGKWKKPYWTIVLAPIIFLVGMTPQDINEIELLGVVVACFGVFFGVVYPSILTVTAKLRGVKGQHAENQGKA